MALLDRKPYRRQASLISRPMVRHIVVQSFFQLLLLLLLLWIGPYWFGIPSGEWCAKYDVDSSDGTIWNAYTGDKDPTGGVTCASFSQACDTEDYLCYSDEDFVIYPLYGDDNSNPGQTFKFDDLDDFGSECLTCERLDHTHGTIIFNTFVFCQIFNEYNSKSLTDNWDVFSDILTNHMFIIVSVVTTGLQLFLIYVGGEFLRVTPLTGNQWLATLGLALITFPVGILMRFIPVAEDPKSFFDNSGDIVPGREGPQSAGGTGDASKRGSELSGHNKLEMI